MGNGAGGFLVFRIHDSRTKPPAERIVGIDPADDFNKLFADKMSVVDPPPAYRVRAEPIAIAGSSQVLRVVEVLTILAPHAVDGRFMKRIAGGAVPMSASEVRAMILKNEEQRAKMRLLMLELLSAQDAARKLNAFAEHKQFASSIRRIDTATLTRLHAETLPLLAPVHRASDSLSVLCAAAEALNFQLDCIAPLIGAAIGQDLDFEAAARIVARSVRSRNDVEMTVDVIMRELRKHFPDPAMRGTVDPKQD